ncbi:hypothetical protein AHAS_Ahas09G0129100 [Arachis hypogaea]
MPRLRLQVARPSDFLELAYHAFDTKWHAIVEVLLKMSLACHAHIHAWTSSLDFSTGVPRLAPSVPRQCIFVAFAPSGTPVLHAQLLVCLLPIFDALFHLKFSTTHLKVMYHNIHQIMHELY